MKLESLSVCSKRMHNHGQRPPLIMFSEFADEIGISPGALKQLFAGSMRLRGIPLPECKVRVTNSAYYKSYYDKRAIRDWWEKTKAATVKPTQQGADS